MKVLFINPNNYIHPPVPPIGIEYLYGFLKDQNHELHFVDLCFASDPKKEIINAISDFDPDIACISIRQIDTVLYQNNIFFLDEIKDLVNVFHQYNINVVVGGSGYSVMPGQILKYTNADYGISGPGENALSFLLDNIETKQEPFRIINGYKFLRHNEAIFPKRELISDYKKYLENDGIGGFRTQIGCFGQCFFCTESFKPVFYFYPDGVTNEINQLKERDVNKFHLCDSEFNQNLDYCKTICNSIIKNCKNIDWTLYMKPFPFDIELFDLLARSGASMITLSIDSKNDINKLDNLYNFFKYANQFKIKTVIDLSVGYPGEKKTNIELLINFINKQPINQVGINTYYRVYPGTLLHEMIRSKPDKKNHLINYDDSDELIQPVFYNSIKEEFILKLIKDKPKFRIEGYEKAVNYQRVK